MITINNNNLPVCAPECSDLNALLPKFRTFSANEALQLSDLIAFLTTPSDVRTRFLNTLQPEMAMRDTKYLIQNYS